MQNQYVGAWIKGFYRVASYAIKADMIDKKIEAKLKVLAFWDKHGLEATVKRAAVHFTAGRSNTINQA